MSWTAQWLVVALLEANFAGSVYLNQPFLLRADDDGTVSSATARGTNAEVSLKVSRDVNEHLGAQAKVCFGCHGFMADMAYVDVRVVDEFAVRFGRFPVPFGEFYLRYDPANHITASKPLPYSMGRMLRREQYNLAVLPEPYPDDGVQLFGTAFRGEAVELSYAAYAVAGLIGTPATGDMDWIAKRSEYFADNNRSPAVGGRVEVASPEVPGLRWLAVGMSTMLGYYDADDEHGYTVIGAHALARVGRFNVRGEVLTMRTHFEDDQSRFRYRLEDLFIARDGFYLEVDGPLGVPMLDWIVRWDGFRRVGAVPVASPVPDANSGVYRYTAGLLVRPLQRLGIKIDYEFWDFWDFENEHLVHLGGVGTF